MCSFPLSRRGKGLESDLNRTRTERKERKVGKRPIRSPEQQENRLITLAVRRAEEMLEAGTAPPSIITHYLKLATSRERLEQERLRAENDMLRSKKEALDASIKGAEAYTEVLEAFKSYAIAGSDDADVR